VDKVTIPVKQEGECYISLLKEGMEGYTRVRLGDKYMATHRFVYQVLNGEISDDLVVRHLCNNRKCIYPPHLAAGTHADNVQDRVNAERSASGRNNGRAKLTNTKVKQILHKHGKTNAELAEEYGVSRKVIYCIRKGLTWKHIRRPKYSRPCKLIEEES